MPPLLLLHGALGAAAQLDPLRAALPASLAPRALDLEGHGAAPALDRPFRIEQFAEGVLAWLDQERIERAAIFGYSMGGYVALQLAATHPDRVGAVMTLATKFRWDAEGARREGRMLDPATIEAKVPHFARTLAARHPAGWTRVVHRTREMMEALGDRAPLDDDALRSIGQPVRVCVGDRDATVSVEESAGIARLLPNGELEVLPATPHPFEKVRVERLAAAIVDWAAGNGE
jgi:pimeloyl-ACP methyl ester carboxylesterase